MADPGEAPLPIFRPNWGPKGRKIFGDRDRDPGPRGDLKWRNVFPKIGFAHAYPHELTEQENGKDQQQALLSLSGLNWRLISWRLVLYLRTLLSYRFKPQ